MATTVMEMAKMAASTSSTARITSRAITGSFTNNHPLNTVAGPSLNRNTSPKRPATIKALATARVDRIGANQTMIEGRLFSIGVSMLTFALDSPFAQSKKKNQPKLFCRDA